MVIVYNKHNPKPRPLLDAILNGASSKMPHNCCVPKCRKKGYRTVTIDGKLVKVSFHKLPDTSSKQLRLKWLHAMRRDVGISVASMFVCSRQQAACRTRHGNKCQSVLSTIVHKACN